MFTILSFFLEEPLPDFQFLTWERDLAAAKPLDEAEFDLEPDLLRLRLAAGDLDLFDAAESSSESLNAFLVFSN